MPQIDFDIKAAKKSGASNKDIAEYFKSNYKIDFDFEQAANSGVSDDDVISYINQNYGSVKKKEPTISSATQLLSQGANVLGGGILGDISKSVPKTEQKEKPRSKYDQPKVNPNRFLDIGEPVVDPNFGKNKAGLMVGQVPDSKPAFAPELAIRKGELQGRLANVLSTGKRPTNDELGQIAMIQSELQSIPQSEADAAFQKDGWEIFKKNPLLGTEFLGETVLSSLTSLFEAGKRTVPAAIGIGAAAGAPIAGIGAIGGAISGLTAGVTTGGFNLSTSGKIIQTLSDEGVDVADKDSLIAAFSDEVKMSKIRKRALKYGIPIAVLDAISGGFAGKLVAGAAGKSLAKRTLAGFGEVGMQSFAGMTGEAGGQYLADGKLNRDEILLEGIAGLVTDVPEIASGVAMEKLKERSSSKKTLAKQVAVLGNEIGSDDAKYNLNRDLANKVITPEEHEQGVAFVEKAVEINNKIPEIVIGENRATSIELIEERERLTEEVNQREEQKKGIDVAYHKVLDESNKEVQKRIDEINNQLGELAKPEKNKVEKEEVIVEDWSKDVESIEKNLKDKIVISPDGRSNNLWGIEELVPYEEKQEIMRLFIDGDYSKSVPISRIIAEAYNKAKSDNSNPKLVKAVEDLLGKPKNKVVEEEIQQPIEVGVGGDVQKTLDDAEYQPRSDRNVILRLPIDKVLNIQEAGENVARGQKGVDVRIDKIKQFLKGKPKKLEASLLNINKDNSLGIDGRHRLEAAKEMGATHAMFEIKKSSEQSLRDLIGEQQIPDENIQQPIGEAKPKEEVIVEEEIQQPIEKGKEDKTGLVLYHGSPHSFENFDISKLGSGEGAQAFGYGLYFTNETDIAKGYANKLSSRKNFWDALIEGNNLSLSKEDYDFINNELDSLGFDGAKAEGADLGNILVDGKEEYSPQVLDAMSILFGKNAVDELSGYDLTKEQIDRLMSIKKKISDPQFYKVSVHKGKSPSEYDYIDWAVPLSESQRKKIGRDLPENISGESFYKSLVEELGSDKKTSEFLLSKGVDGITYKSNKGTGGKSGKGRNYVVFDSNSIEVEEINDVPQPKKEPKEIVEAVRVEQEPEAKEGVKVVTLSGMDENERVELVEQRRKDTKLNDEEVRHNEFVDLQKSIATEKSRSGKNEIVNKIRQKVREINVELGSDVYKFDGVSVRKKNKKGVYKKVTRTNKDNSGRAIKENAVLITDRDSGFAAEFEKLTDSPNFEALEVDRGDKTRMTKQQIEAAYEDAVNGVPSVQADNLLNVLEEAYNKGYFEIVDRTTEPYTRVQVPFNEFLGVQQEEVGQPMDEEEVLNWLNEIQELPQEEQIEIDNIILEYEQQPQQIDISGKVQSPKPESKEGSPTSPKPSEEGKGNGSPKEKVGGEPIAEAKPKQEDVEPKTPLEEKYEQINKLRGEKVKELAKQKLISDNFDSIVAQLMTKNKIKRKC